MEDKDNRSSIAGIAGIRRLLPQASVGIVNTSPDALFELGPGRDPSNPPREASLSQRYDRRAFLRRASAIGLAAPAISILGCRLEERQREDEETGFDGFSITRPVLLPWTDDVVRIAAPLSEPPLAYVSRGLLRVYVDLDARQEIAAMLAAHISVSTGLWRIPLPGDDLAIPVEAGDALREFEETHLGQWDPTMTPAVGDFRVRRGEREGVRVDFDCVPMANREGFFSAGPWDIAQCRGRGEALCREDFGEVGTGSLYGRRALGTCSEPEGAVGYVTWASRDNL
jgi:hypothetical protein